MLSLLDPFSASLDDHYHCAPPLHFTKKPFFFHSLPLANCAYFKYILSFTVPHNLQLFATAYANNDLYRLSLTLNRSRFEARMSNLSTAFLFFLPLSQSLSNILIPQIHRLRTLCLSLHPYPSSQYPFFNVFCPLLFRITTSCSQQFRVYCLLTDCHLPLSISSKLSFYSPPALSHPISYRHFFFVAHKCCYLMRNRSNLCCLPRFYPYRSEQKRALYRCAAASPMRRTCVIIRNAVTLSRPSLEATLRPQHGLTDLRASGYFYFDCFGSETLFPLTRTRTHASARSFT